MNHSQLHLVCSGCHSVNRVPQTRLKEGPLCGQCRHHLAPSDPITLTDDSFEKFIFRTDLPVVVDFWAPWCGPCRMMAPAYAEAAEKLSPDVLLAKLDTDQAPVTAGHFNIQGIPCLILFHEGQEIARQAGAMGSDEIVRWARSVAPG